VGDLLSFKPDRDLAFDSDRELGFEPNRPLLFDSGRSLNFLPSRDLGFGRRGVVFRGYVCPICGALATEDAPKCSECGAVFEAPPRAPGPSVPTAAELPAPRAPRGPAPTSAASPGSIEARTSSTGKFCAFCGARLTPADGFCWNCGARSVGPAEAVRLPGAKKNPVTREWRGPEER